MKYNKRHFRGNIMETTIIQLIEKSKEAFTLAIELYNKPTIKYRVEGFSLFICNAWELMLKAHMINKFGHDSIYYKDNPDRTISLENCITKIFTNNKDPLRLNLEKIIELRNTSTHFITEEYEMIYIPLFQACVFNFNEKMLEFHNIDMTEIIPKNFLTLTVSMKSLDVQEIRTKYPKEIANKLININSNLLSLSNENNQSFSIKVDHYYYITKDKNKATSFVNVSKNAKTPVKIIKELKDPNNTHKYTAKACIEEINKRLLKLKITPRQLKIVSTNPKKEPCFNMYHFQLFCDYFGLKKDSRFCYGFSVSNSHNKYYKYSLQTIEFIVDEIKKNPDNIIENLKSKVKK